MVEETTKPQYLEIVKALMTSDLPFHLISGEQSRTAWDVPDWAAESATSFTELPGAGHLMMLQSPESFGAAVRRALGNGC